MSSDFLLIYGKTWQSIYNALKRKEMNLREAAVWMVRTGSPSLGWEGGWAPELQPGVGWVGGSASLFGHEDMSPSWQATKLWLELAWGSGSSYPLSGL